MQPVSGINQELIRLQEENRILKEELIKEQINASIGKTVLSALSNEQNDFVILETTTGKVYLTWKYRRSN